MPEDTSDYFTKTTTFNESVVTVTITADGAKALYGSDDPASVAASYEVQYLYGHDASDVRIDAESYGENYADYQGKIAGTH